MDHAANKCQHRTSRENSSKPHSPPKLRSSSRRSQFETHTRSRSRTSSSSSRSRSRSSKKSNLRRRLSSLAWVQCDNIKCLKWRKISSADAENLADKSWTCSMNDDPDFQSCSVPEEDTALFDRLAKKAKLDLIKSEIKKGSLVWAKMDGYCRWPALITDDPACGMHADGDEEEVFWYHVEFLGNERSHGWLRTERVEIFGANAEKLDSKEASTTKAQNIVRRGRKKAKGKGNGTSQKGSKLKKTYRGGSTVQKAITEALTLLPLQLHDRLKTCWFMFEDSGLDDSAFSSGGQKEKRKDNNNVPTFSKKKKQVPNTSKSSPNEPHGLPARHSLIKRNPERRKNKTLDNINAKKADYEEADKDKKSKTKACKSDNSAKDSGIMESSKSPSGLKCLNFPSSLIDTSKEERFMLDVQMYQRNEKAFEEDVNIFMTRHKLSLSTPPIWQHAQVSIFSIFLAVYERGGYDLVCENHLWGQVYAEVTHQQTKQGSIVKNFYKRNIYAYELFVTGQDWKLAVKSLQLELMQQELQTCRDLKTPNSSFSMEIISDVSEESSSDISEYLDSLDEILQELGQQENEDAQQVPNVNQIRVLNSLDFGPMENLVDTASITGKAQQPEEDAQVVPELDFPSSVESSDQGSDLQGFHEMQALQLDVGELDDHINHL